MQGDEKIGLELKHRSLLKLNLKLFLDMHLLREGAFTNVASGQLFYDGSDMSVLLPDTSADDTLVGVSDGQVWQSPFRQFVYESGVPLDGTNVPAPPIVCSGLLIEGAFRGPGDPEFGHTIDYQNGRVIFNDPQSSDLKVNAAFSYREVRVGFEHDFNQQFRLGYLESKYATNPGTSMQIVYPSGLAQPFPAVFIEINERNFEPYEMGNRSLQIIDQVVMHIWALNDLQRDNIVDTLTAQMRKALPIIDFNKAPIPLSGIFNTLSPEYVPYQTMLRNNTLVTTVGSGTPVRFIGYIDNATSNNVEPAEEYERSMVEYDLRVILNAPTTPLGHIFGPISNIPPLGDTGF